MTTGHGSSASILDLARQLVDDWGNEKLQNTWDQRINDASISELVVVTSRLSSNLVEENKWGASHPRIKALREAVISQVERKNADQVTTAVGEFKASADKLAGKTFWATVLVIILTVVLIIQTGILIWLETHHEPALTAEQGLSDDREQSNK